MYTFLAKFYPRNLREKYKKMLMYADINVNPMRFLGFMIFTGLTLGLAFSFGLALLIPVAPFILFIGFFFALEVLFYFLIALRADSKARFIEDVLPDALQLMASNLRAGLTMDKALLLSARPEFGPLQSEINWIGKEITIGKSISDALFGMSQHIKSDKLRKTVLLIDSGLRSGGELASLLEQTATDLRDQKFISEKTQSSVMMYTIFIFVAVAIGSPTLFGLSSFLIEVLKKNIAQIDLPSSVSSSGSLPLTFSEVNISDSFVVIYVITSIITSAVLGSMMLGLIGKGREKRGLKYIPIIAGMGIGIFFLTRFVIGKLLGSLFGF